MARFLTDEDYYTLIKNTSLMAVVSANLALLPKAENAAQERIESHLSQRYDMAHTFSQTGENRNPLIVMYMVDIALYDLHSLIAGKQVPKEREDRFLAAMDWLEMAADGKITPKLERAVKESDGTGKQGIAITSLPKFNSDY